MKKFIYPHRVFAFKYDSLTGLYNKKTFYKKVKKQIVEDSSRIYYLIYSNIDDFKFINDMFGYKKGDEILKNTARLLKKIGQGNNISARINSDRFAVLVEDFFFREEKLFEISATLKKLYRRNGIQVNIHFGIYKIENGESNVNVIAGCSKRILKTIKGNSIKVFAYYDEMFKNFEKNERDVITNFDSALENQEFKIFLQPQISFDGKLKGAEVLARWVTKENKIISPDKFIGPLERTGLISKLDENIWCQAAKLLKQWERTEKQDLNLSINLSVKDFENLDIYETITNLVKKYDIPPQKLKLEITESAFMSDAEKTLETIHKFRKAGFYVEIDDFGKGYSSLSLLKDIEVDMLKIDMDFLKKTKDEIKSIIILESIITLTKNLGIDVITEGVETKAQVDSLNQLGCSLFQGYYFSKPISVPEFEKKYS